MMNIRHLGLRITSACQFSTSVINRQRYTPKENSGMYRRLKLISEDEPDLSKADIDYESLEELEEDIMQAGEMSDEIISEMGRISKQHQFQITERKHFRPPKEPNMLTWSEKEQIRGLHLSDPQKWDPNTLADSFPATADIIKKILKFKWKPSSVERVKEHDRKVSENWKAFHRGLLKVHDPQLQAHLEKFIDRKDGVQIISDEDAVKVTEIILPKPKRTEFLSLVKGLKAENDTDETEVKTKQLEDQYQTVQKSNDKSSLSLINRSNANYTLERYRKRLQEVDDLSETPEDIKAIINQKKPEMTETGQSSERYVAPSERFLTNAVVYQNKNKDILKLRDIDNLPNRITIPKENWQAGLLYRVNDSFYNDKGYFLYRVPGLKP